MKKIRLMIVLMLLIVFVFPTGVMAGKAPVDLTVDVYNKTGGMVELDLVNEDGVHTYLSFDTGVHEFTIAEGVYNYYAVTPCGNLAGNWNINVSKNLWLECADGASATLQKDCRIMLWVPGYNWYEKNPDWWEWLQENLGASFECYDGGETVWMPYS